ncbi:Gfo/Idh/MocA family protein [Thermophagus sp. OGC60D27]|uniref:Gfo/Idh/MocA family protein n=1 Tax=Thermophagus sp. OGC60D27 TaxID=3458415 RepID=UPI00403836E0
MKNNINSRREFIKKTAFGAAGVTLAGMGMTAKSYASIPGANDRLNIAIVGLGRRLGAYLPPIAMPQSNVRLLYLCDVMEKQRVNAGKTFSKALDYAPKQEENFFKVLDDPNVDAVLLATPDHWHAPGTWLANEAGKHVYVEKPCSHNPYEGELLVKSRDRYGKIIQMGNQQRSSAETIEIIREIHNGIIGTPYMAKAFYSNNRGRVINPVKAPVPTGLNWDLWQGPAPRKSYEHNTWDYNWHWYGWDYGTAETGNNAIHELDVARWALQVKFPEEVIVDAGKYHWIDDGWTMYDTMDATLRFPGNKIIKWDGKSRNGHNTYGGGRGTIIYGTEGTVWVDRGGYKLYDRNGHLIREKQSGTSEGGTQLGGGGDMSTQHVRNFFEAIRGKEEQRSPIDEGAISTLLGHLANIGSRTGEILQCDPANGHILNSYKAMSLWEREYEKGWEPKL